MKLDRKKKEDERFEVYKAELEKEGKIIPEDTRKLYKEFKVVKAEQDIVEHDKFLYKPHGTGTDYGNYQLIGVVTHHGRSAKGGHYVGWAHRSGEDWVEYDDDVTS